MTDKPVHAPVSALALAAEIDAGRLTPLAAVERSIAAIEAHDDILSAFVTTDFAGARRAAATAGGPLRGLALGVKDTYDTAEMPTGLGSPIYAGNRPVADASLVALARRAGAAMVGKTLTTEFAFMQSGPTRNPAKLDHTPGGSSSGSAAAVAAGMIPLALGTQTGGSVIRPAAFCGVAGFKPSFRLLPTVGIKVFAWSIDTAGLFGAGVADVAFFAEALTGRDLRVDRRPLAAPRIGIARTHLWPEASGEMRNAVETAGRLAEAAGASLRDIELPGIFADAYAAHQTIQDYQAAQAMAWELDHHAERLSPILRETLDLGRGVSPADYDRARGTARRARLALKDVFAEVDVLLTPSAPGAAPEGLSSTGISIFNRVWTLMGTPAINVPGLHGHGRLPLGVQVVAPFGRDRAGLEAAAFLEAAIAAA